MSGLLTRAGYEPIAVENMEAAKEEVAKLPPGAVIVADYKLPDGSAKELVNWQKGEGFSFPVIAIVNNLNGPDLLDVLSDGGAVNVIQRAAIDKQLVETVARYAKPENIVLQFGNSLIPRHSKAFREIKQSIERVAATNANCIIFGESGMGKEQIARQIYLQSSRTQKPLIVLEAGGAVLVGRHNPKSDRSEMYNRIEGYFQEAKDGTLVIKNIQLLTFEKQSVHMHIFRALYARQRQLPKKHLDASAIKALKLHPWPGNIRELKDKVLHIAFLVAEDVIAATDIKFEYAMPDTVEELIPRNPKAVKERIIKAFFRAGIWSGATKRLGISDNRNGEIKT